MKIFKPLVGSSVLVLCSLAFSVQAQTSTGSADTTATPAANSGSGSVKNGPENTGSPNSGAISDGGDKTKESEGKSQNHSRHGADTKKCDGMSGDAKEACKKGAKGDRDGHHDGTANKQ